MSDTEGQEPEGGEPEEVLLDPRPELPALVNLRGQVQGLRIAESNRVGSSERLASMLELVGEQRAVGDSDEDIRAALLTTWDKLTDEQIVTVMDSTREPELERRRAQMHVGYRDQLLILEHSIEKSLRVEMTSHPAWPWLSEIHGVAEVSAALVVGYIDITRANSVSALWRYMGFSVVTDACPVCEGTGEITSPEGTVGQCLKCRGTGLFSRSERAVKGEPLHFNRRAKSMVFRLMSNQVRLNGPYAYIYRQAKQTYITTRMAPNGDWTLLHCDRAARRKASKRFLSHLWLVWREAVGLPTSVPFIGRDPAHDIDDPWEYVREHNPPKKKAVNE